MKSFALALFALAGLASASSVIVVNPGPLLCFPSGGISGGGTNQVNIDASVQFPGIENAPPSTCSMTVIADLMTDGPARPGVLSFTLFTDIDSIGVIFLNGTRLAGCVHFCGGPLMVPVTLGQGFEITEVVNASYGGGINGESTSGDIHARVQALDGGSPVTISEGQPPTPAPEPGTMSLAIMALGSILLRKQLPSDIPEPQKQRKI